MVELGGNSRFGHHIHGGFPHLLWCGHEVPAWRQEWWWLQSHPIVIPGVPVWLLVSLGGVALSDVVRELQPDVSSRSLCPEPT